MPWGQSSAYLRLHPELTLQEIVPIVMRDQTPDDLDFRPMVSEAWAAAGGDVDEFWADLDARHREAAEAVRDVVLIPMIIEIAREERAPG